jgi:prepilin-type N-terminal cleavage/methylation domain-containing protein
MTSLEETIDPTAGFTLLEVLITLVLLSLLTLALFGSLRFGMHIWEGSAATTAGLDNVRAAEQQITELISEAYPQMDFRTPTRPVIAFEGRPANLRVLVPDAEIKGAMTYATLRIVPTDQGGDLVLERRLELAAIPEKQVTQVLLRGIRAFQISYFGQDAHGAKPYWHREWQAKTRQPLFVRMRADLADPHVAWPELIVAPQIAGDIDCIAAEPVTGNCQGH